MAKEHSMDVSPVNQMVSDYPLPLSTRRAKYEAERARYHRWELPRGHPYYFVHPAIPYAPAYVISRLTSFFIR